MSPPCPCVEPAQGCPDTGLLCPHPFIAPKRSCMPCSAPSLPSQVECCQVMGKLGPKGWAGGAESVKELLEPGPLGCRAAAACPDGEPCPQCSRTCLSSQLVFPFDFHPSFPSVPAPAPASSSVCCRSRDAHVLLLVADAP